MSRFQRQNSCCILVQILNHNYNSNMTASSSNSVNEKEREGTQSLHQGFEFCFVSSHQSLQGFGQLQSVTSSLGSSNKNDYKSSVMRVPGVLISSQSRFSMAAAMQLLKAASCRSMIFFLSCSSSSSLLLLTDLLG